MAERRAPGAVGIPNIEFFSLAEKIPGEPEQQLPDVPTWSARDYGNRIGVFRFMEVFDRYGIRATVALNSDICIHHPAIIEEGNKRHMGVDGFITRPIRAASSICPRAKSRRSLRMRST